MSETREDFLGQIIAVGDYVLASTDYRTPQLFKITKFTPQRVRLIMVGTSHDTIRTAGDLVKIDPVLITMFKLKQGG